MSKVCKRGDTNGSGTVYKELKDMFKVSRISIDKKYFCGI
jgi:hypothetical protein